MRQEVRNDILRILQDTLEILKSKEPSDSMQLKEVSDHVIHDILLYQDEDAISIALLIYSLYKILSRDTENTLVYQKIVPSLLAAKNALQQENEKMYRSAVAGMFKVILSVDTKLRLYFQEILDKAKISKGTKLYEHGISIAHVASLLGISQWELLQYIGKTQIIDCQECKSDVKSRLRSAKEIFS